MSYPPLPSSKDISTDQFLAYYVLYTPLVAYLALEPRRTPKFTPTPPSNLSDLNEIRFNSLPATLKERETKNGQAWINKEELQELVAWKLYGIQHVVHASNQTTKLIVSVLTVPMAPFVPRFHL